MGWFSGLIGKIAGGPPSGVTLDYSKAHWMLEGKSSFVKLLPALEKILSDDCVLYFEGGYYRGKLEKFLKAHSVTSPLNIAVGTLWPKPECFHIPATKENISALVELCRGLADAELAIHFHVYSQGRVILEWHDAFAEPMILADEIGESKIREFADSLGFSCCVCQDAHSERDKE